MAGSGSSNGWVKQVAVLIAFTSALVGTVLYAADKPSREEVKTMVADAPAIVEVKTKFDSFVLHAAEDQERNDEKHKEILEAIKDLKK